MVIEVPLGCKRFLHSKADYPFRLLFKYFLTADRSWTCPSTKIHQRFGTAILLNNVTAGKGCDWIYARHGFTPKGWHRLAACYKHNWYGTARM